MHSIPWFESYVENVGQLLWLVDSQWFTIVVSRFQHKIAVLYLRSNFARQISPNIVLCSTLCCISDTVSGVYSYANSCSNVMKNRNGRHLWWSVSQQAKIANSGKQETQVPISANRTAGDKKLQSAILARPDSLFMGHGWRWPDDLCNRPLLTGYQVELGLELELFAQSQLDWHGQAVKWLILSGLALFCYVTMQHRLRHTEQKFINQDSWLWQAHGHHWWENQLNILLPTGMRDIRDLSFSSAGMLWLFRVENAKAKWAKIAAEEN